MNLLGSNRISSQVQEPMKLSKAYFKKGIIFSKTWTLDNRIERSYYLINGMRGDYSKIMAIEDENPLTIYKLWKYGLLHQIHITGTLKFLENFPQYFKMAMVNFRKITRSQRQVLCFTSSLPVLNEDGKIIFPPYH